MPYCVFDCFEEVRDFTFDLEFEEVFVQFSYYSDTASGCDTGIEAIKDRFDYATLTLTGYDCLKMERETVFNPEKIEPDGIWVGIVRYTLLMQQDTVATPTMNPAGGIYGASQDVTISCSTSGATIYYTTDGTTPTSGSTEYSAPVSTGTGATTIKAIAIADHYINSEVTSETYTVTIDVSLSPVVTGDDGHDYSDESNFETANTYYEIGSRNATLLCRAFIRFPATIPEGSTINSAYLDLYSAGSSSATVDPIVAVYFYKTSGSAAPISSAEITSFITNLSSGVQWDLNPSDVAVSPGDKLTSPDLSTIMQEIVDLGTYSKGDSFLVFILDDGSTDFERYNIHSCVAGTAAVLRVNYE